MVRRLEAIEKAVVGAKHEFVAEEGDRTGQFGSRAKFPFGSARASIEGMHHAVFVADIDHVVRDRRSGLETGSEVVRVFALNRAVRPLSFAGLAIDPDPLTVEAR